MVLVFTLLHGRVNVASFRNAALLLLFFEDCIYKLNTKRRRDYALASIIIKILFGIFSSSYLLGNVFIQLYCFAYTSFIHKYSVYHSICSCKHIPLQPREIYTKEKILLFHNHSLHSWKLITIHYASFIHSVMHERFSFMNTAALLQFCFTSVWKWNCIYKLYRCMAASIGPKGPKAEFIQRLHLFIHGITAVPAALIRG